MDLKKHPLIPVLLLSGLVACSNNDSMSLMNKTTSGFSDPVGEQFYNVLAGEMYGEAGDDMHSLQHYMSVAMVNDDPKIAKRATQIASRSGQNNKAVTAAKRWLQLAPDSLEARQYLALLLLRQQKFKASAEQLYIVQQGFDKEDKNGVELIAALLAAERNHEYVYQMYKHYRQINTDKNNHKVDLILSSLAYKAGHYSEALTYIEPVEKDLKGETKEQALLLKSKILHKLNKGDEAMKVLSPLMKSKSTTDVALLEYVRLLILDGRNKDAVNVLARLNQKHPDNFEISKALIALYLDLQEFTLAEKQIPNLLRSKQYQGVAHHFRAEIYESRNELDAALNEYQLVQDGELYDSAQTRIPHLLMQQHGIHAARSWLHKKVSSSKIDKIKSKFLAIEAQMFLEQKDYSTAVDLYNEADELTPDNIDIRYSRGIGLQELKSFDEAEKDFRFVLSRKKDDVNTLNALGYMLASHTDRFDEAHQLITRALSLRPGDGMIIDSLGWLHYKKGELGKAELQLRKAYEQSDDPEIASHLIEVLTKQGKSEEALAIFKDVIERYPEDAQLRRVKQKIIDYNPKS